MVPAGAVAHLLEVMQEKYPVRAEDRVAETTATSFDLSVYNMFVTWKAGASLHIVPFSQTLAPARFIIEHEVSVWLSVPSVANLLSRAKLLHPGVFPSLRLTFFAGEPLLAEMAAEWQAATRNSVVANLYGPTEATVVCLGQDYSNKCVLTRDSVGIGQCLRGTDARILSPENTWQRDGEPGELLLSGSQLALGYLDDPEKTTAKFVQLDGVRWYKTGDLAMRDSSGFFHFLGRIDNQVKIMGFRVELEDIEFYLRKVTGCEAVCAIPWPYHNGSAAGVIAFIGSPIHDAAATKEELRKYLPNYFVPSQIRRLDELPTNTNGKIDRSVLQERLQRECTD
jgi:non-ribosomal peptide synthetase component F